MEIIRNQSTKAHLKNKVRYDRKVKEINLVPNELCYVHFPGTPGTKKKFVNFFRPMVVTSIISQYQVRVHPPGKEDRSCQGCWHF